MEVIKSETDAELQTKEDIVSNQIDEIKVDREITLNKNDLQIEPDLHENNKAAEEKQFPLLLTILILVAVIGFSILGYFIWQVYSFVHVNKAQNTSNTASASGPTSSIVASPKITSIVLNLSQNPFGADSGTFTDSASGLAIAYSSHIWRFENKNTLTIFPSQDAFNNRDTLSDGNQNARFFFSSETSNDSIDSYVNDLYSKSMCVAPSATATENTSSSTSICYTAITKLTINSQNFYELTGKSGNVSYIAIYGSKNGKTQRMTIFYDPSFNTLVDNVQKMVTTVQIL